VRRNRLRRETAEEALEVLQAFGVEIWAVDLKTCFDLACEYGLAAYDAAHLALALESRSPLWTPNGPLAAAVRRVGVPVMPAG
jgi:predicted nucleic acid-binding protein